MSCVFQLGIQNECANAYARRLNNLWAVIGSKVAGNAGYARARIDLNIAFSYYSYEVNLFFIFVFKTEKYLLLKYNK